MFPVLSRLRFASDSDRNFYPQPGGLAENNLRRPRLALARADVCLRSTRYACIGCAARGNRFIVVALRLDGRGADFSSDAGAIRRTIRKLRVAGGNAETLLRISRSDTRRHINGACGFLQNR